MEEYKCKFNPMGIICDGQTLCSFCGWNPMEAERRKSILRRQARAGKPLKLRVKKMEQPKFVIEDWTGCYDPE